uniref:Uncharacterized protein n=1 Tax=Rhizophora mucronata TaxID=61149 RepID=A0A2P2Q8B0_RHIMU
MTVQMNVQILTPQKYADTHANLCSCIHILPIAHDSHGYMWHEQEI